MSTFGRVRASGASPITMTSLGAELSSENVTTFAMSSFTLPANRLGLLFVVSIGATPPSNTPTVPGWTEYLSHNESDIRRITLFHRVVSSDTTEGPTISFGGQNQNLVAYSVQHCDENAVITGTNGANGIVQALGSGLVHGPAVVETAILDPLDAFESVNNATISCINLGFEANFATVGPGFTELNRSGIASFSNAGTITQYKTTNDTVHELIDCFNSADMYFGMAVEIRAV